LQKEASGRNLGLTGAAIWRISAGTNPSQLAHVVGDVGFIQEAQCGASNNIYYRRCDFGD